ncbi:MAG: Flp pilus assembly complex ATPase component TadA [Ectothiorhodospiraceae bacterium]|nr:Flp pilus assembly complex ATPase component TadA [Chromatiales bacterium]MCP5156788.1 Flp pilus assembly complex ATPase component TadA [Ectothiorhodospiraceae bacterium]
MRARRIGELLVSKGVVSEDQVRIALTEQRRRKEHLGRILVRLGFATEAVIRDVLGGALGYDSVDLARVVVDGDVVKLIPKEIARRYHMLALTFQAETGTLTVAMADPFNVIALDQVRALLGGEVEIRPLLAGEADLDKAIDQFYGFELSVDGILQEIETGEIDYQSLEAESDEYSQPVVRLVNALLSDAVKRGASDIHFEPEHDFLRIRYRIDGVLRQIRSLHRNYWSAIAVRLKVMAGLNIAEMRAPQDGRISLSVSGRPVDFRVSSLPTTHGENIVLRVLDRQKGIVPLDGLGLDSRQLNTLRLMMARPEGIILVTGPTGSGKTTTLYSMLSHLNTEQVNIMTLEDPVEYPMEMIRQTSVNEAVRLTFANGIRSLMRQDPDVILVGEIRDEDTAVMAFRAAMTGHQVFSTLHTNSAVGSIPRLLDTGIPPDIMAGNIIGVIGQRLVRKLCVQCKQMYEPSRIERQLMKLGPGSDVPPVYRAVGCGKCDHTGYRGRLAIMELLRFDPEVDELVAQRGTVRELLKLAASKGFTTMADDGIRRVLEGVTSMDEVSRVLDLTYGVA